MSNQWYTRRIANIIILLRGSIIRDAIKSDMYIYEFELSSITIEFRLTNVMSET